ncbi:MAG: hypothetical protein MUE49_13710 [Rhodospirillales bacterium]|jgi:hypothetical protein|nr:hypothetical protein [Rhodospirillales bacterium]
MSFDSADLAIFCDPDMPGAAVATLAGGATVNVLFGAPYADAFGIISGNKPELDCAPGTIASGASVTINGIAYTALQVKKSRRAGMVTVELAEA